jgi:L-seryl-tRNA(Ser) seleniumtransferase
VSQTTASLLATRRSFFGWSQAAIAAAFAGSPRVANAASAAHTTEAADYYDKLGVTKIINAAGTYTALTASIMPPPVLAAVAQAAKHPVRLAELQQKAGEYLAKRLRCEGALVCAGAASGVTLGTAACMTVANPDAVLRMPIDTAGMKNEVIVQKTHRYDYDHALLNCGIRFVEVETLDQYEAAFTPRTVMTHFFNAAESTPISREDWVRVAHKHGVPCFNDAAADVPPISNLWNYTGMGFDLVTFSGGKGMRGPQNTGLLLGRKQLIDAAIKNAMPISNTVGRGMKVAKEQIVGMVAAVDWFLSLTDESMETEFRKRAERIADELKSIPTLAHTITIPEVANHVPHLLLSYDRQRIGLTSRAVAATLRAGTPAIELNPATEDPRHLTSLSGTPDPGRETIVVGVWMLQPGEELIVAQRLREVLSGAVKSSS